ncbi:putative LRR receptor-like serine/threonine-protein kinase [Dorcoceras hygrometricum]|uniref:Putative LRR receptor-like serine/threonine-protein kinase n=1 Tax=Dorcoceras hygrometricum TaxID=472368 RepID=A0A2Z7AE52_9LAMI|nr:putative LRR receptor-like serine/threonine-protein kinase [Dorcoceras hygrometricum]
MQMLETKNFHQVSELSNRLAKQLELWESLQNTICLCLRVFGRIWLVMFRLDEELSGEIYVEFGVDMKLARGSVSGSTLARESTRRGHVLVNISELTGAISIIQILVNEEGEGFAVFEDFREVRPESSSSSFELLGAVGNLAGQSGALASRSPFG